MAVAERRYEPILIDEDRVARIASTTIKVIELVLVISKYWRRWENLLIASIK